MKKFTIIIIITVALAIAYPFAVNYLVFHTGKGRPATNLEKLEISKKVTKNEEIALYITHQFPFVNLDKFNVLITGVVSDKVYYLGSYKDDIKVASFQTKEPLQITLINDNLEYVYGSQGGAVGDMSNAKSIKLTLFFSYSEKYLGWYKLEAEK